MDFLDQLNSELSKFNIPNVSAIPLLECEITRPYMLKRAGLDPTREATVCMFVMPYYVSDKVTNISHYAKSRDYHLFFRQMSSQVISALKQNFKDNIIAGFADTSPINERHAAARAGLGVLGDNGMLITEQYSSFVFIGEFITDLTDIPTHTYEISHCRGCGRCRSVCPMLCGAGECLSSLTQKKGKLSEDEEKILKKYNSAWGCDICQECCPYTETAKRRGTIYTSIDFFREHRTEQLSSALLADMTDSEFMARAYSWRGRDTVMRNLNILENRGEEQQK